MTEERREPVGNSDCQRESEQRGLNYTFLSNMFLEEVTEEFLRHMKEQCSLLEGEWERYAAGLPSEDLGVARTEAAADFAALLLNMSADPVFPYESVYMSEERLLMRRARDEVLALYRGEGFMCTETLNVPEDHVGIEMEFMARLCDREAKAYAAGDSRAAQAVRGAQRAFLHDHLMKWVPRLCDDLAARAGTGLYRGLAETTRLYLAFECEELDLSRMAVSLDG